MQPDEEGFLYPSVDSALCVDCGQCEKRCPANRQPAENKPIAFCAQNTNKTVRVASSSGGIFSALARETLNDGGVVFGAVFDPDWKVEHVGAITEQEIAAMRGSKYVQSDAAEAIGHAAELVRKEVPVLFSGTPCQVAGLYALLGEKKLENLTTVDFVCHGVPSPSVFRSYLEELQSSHGSPIVSYSFRDKRRGWRDFSAVATFRDRSICSGTQREDPFLVGFLANLYLRPSCHGCTGLRNGNHPADLTLADFWGAERILTEKDDDTGLSLVFANTKKGMDRLQLMHQIERNAVSDLSPLYTANPSILSPAPPHDNRERFFRRFRKHGFRAKEIMWLVKPKNNLIMRALRKLRRMLRKMAK